MDWMAERTTCVGSERASWSGVDVDDEASKQVSRWRRCCHGHCWRTALGVGHVATEAEELHGGIQYGSEGKGRGLGTR